MTFSGSLWHGRFLEAAPVDALKAATGLFARMSGSWRSLHSDLTILVPLLRGVPTVSRTSATRPRIELFESLGTALAYRDTMGFLKHFARTLIHIAAILLAILLIIVITVKLNLSAYVILIGIVGVIGFYIYWSGPRHAYWAPAAKRIVALKWTSGDGQKMETVVEKAIVQFGVHGRSEALRVSAYPVGSERLLWRKVVGDNATFLGRHGIGIWFHIADRFHARRDGLVCLDIESGKWLYHVPKSEIQSISPGPEKGIYSIEDDEENEIGTIDLANEEANLPS